jgi:serine/threonine-protein phosphatase 2B regulatory subunit
VVSIFDKNKDGTISFEEFVTGLSALYSNDEEAKITFAFKVYDLDDDGYITNGELFKVLKMMVGSNLNDMQLQQLVDRTIIKADEDFDGKISFMEFKKMVKDLDVASKLTLT